MGDQLEPAGRLVRARLPEVQRHARARRQDPGRPASVLTIQTWMIPLFDVFFLKEITMNRLRYVHWRKEDFHLGYFEDFSDYITQGKTLDELLENLRDLFKDVSSGEIPYIKKVDENVTTRTSA